MPKSTKAFEFGCGFFARVFMYLYLLITVSTEKQRVRTGGNETRLERMERDTRKVAGMIFAIRVYRRLIKQKMVMFADALGEINNENYDR